MVVLCKNCHKQLHKLADALKQELTLTDVIKDLEKEGKVTRSLADNQNGRRLKPPVKLVRKDRREGSLEIEAFGDLHQSF